jgi:hypothetical protein
MAFAQLSPTEKLCAESLGYNAESWDEDKKDDGPQRHTDLPDMDAPLPSHNSCEAPEKQDSPEATECPLESQQEIPTPAEGNAAGNARVHAVRHNRWPPQHRLNSEASVEVEETGASAAPVAEAASCVPHQPADMGQLTHAVGHNRRDSALFTLSSAKSEQNETPMNMSSHESMSDDDDFREITERTDRVADPSWPDLR